ncbi:hypothetical protein [Rhizomonospora bruguierae]|uniref:hypothetical protein n=1 Tax=Rhizomonospora bruguierae TaxID=1581705 RepID=UPI001BCB9EEA|nr:hypothetical protein [Micromonospora sp. NBRC 107566]
MNPEGIPDPFADWAPRPPAPIVPVPAASRPELRGKRLVIGLPGLGWRNDLRGDDPVIQGSRTYVPIVAEQEWYRAEAEQTEVFAPLVPIERVWVETIASTPGPGTPPSDVLSRLVSLDAPPDRAPLPALDAGQLTGRRVVDMSDGERRELRAVTELYANSEGDISVRVAREIDWYRWSWSGKAPETLEVPVHLLWVE